MKSIKTQIEIAASATLVWKILMDFASYPDWNPFLINIEGNACLGSHLNCSIQLKEGKVMQFKPEVLQNKTHQEFRWKGKMWVKGLFDGEHYFELRTLPNGNTLLVHGEVFTGLIVGAVYGMIKADTEAGFVAMNKALKQRTEVLRKEGSNACL